MLGAKAIVVGAMYLISAPVMVLLIDFSVMVHRNWNYYIVETS